MSLECCTKEPITNILQKTRVKLFGETILQSWLNHICSHHVLIRSIFFDVKINTLIGILISIPFVDYYGKLLTCRFDLKFKYFKGRTTLLKGLNHIIHFVKRFEQKLNTHSSSIKHINIKHAYFLNQRTFEKLDIISLKFLVDISLL